MALTPAWLLRIAGSAIMLAILAWMIDWRTFTRAIAGVDAFSVIVTCCVVAAIQVLLGVRWALIARSLSARGFWRQICLFWQAGLLNQVTPAAIGGDLYRVATMRLENASLSLAAGAVVFERALGFAGFASVYLVLYAAAWRNLPPALSTYAGGAAIGFSGLICCGIIAVVLARSKRLWFPKPVATFVSGMSAVVALHDPVRLSAIGLTTLFASSFWIVAVAIVSRSLGFKISMAVTGMITVLTELSRWFPVSIQGIGIRESVFVFASQRLGENMGTAFAVILVAYVLNSFMVLAFGLIAVLLDGWRTSSVLEST